MVLLYEVQGIRRKQHRFIKKLRRWKLHPPPPPLKWRYILKVILTPDTNYVFRSEDDIISAQLVNYGEFDNCSGIELVTTRGTYLFTPYNGEAHKYAAWVGTGKKHRAFITTKGETLELFW